MVNLDSQWISYLRRKEKDKPPAQGSSRPDATSAAAQPQPQQEPASPQPPSPTTPSRVAPPAKQSTPNDDAPRNKPDEEPADEYRRPAAQSGRRLWQENDTPLPASKSTTGTTRQAGRPAHARYNAGQANAPEGDEPETTMILQPETRPISQDQLVAEVKGIYAGLVMVESKCIEVDNAQNSQNDDPPKLSNEQWQALIALHRTLLHEHHDFFLASQHPSASAALRRLASKYAMPARMWRHGIHSFLELLRHRLPGSLEHMLTFIYLAYSMMALLYETVPAFEDTWIECLGDLGRYRMAIEDEDIRDREVWTGVSRHWYSRASDKAPTTGRLYHHLAILARPNGIHQLFYYTKSLTVAIPFTSAKESVLTLFEPVMASSQQRPSFDNAFVHIHAMIFTRKQLENLDEAITYFLSLLDNTAARQTRRWMEPGSYIAISNGNAMLGYGDETNPLMQIVFPAQQEDTADVVMAETSATFSADMPAAFQEAHALANKTDEIIFARFGDPNVLPYVHCRLAFMLHLSYHADAMAFVQDSFCWHLMTFYLNSVLNSLPDIETIDTKNFPRREKGDQRPLPEDWALRGLLWTDRLFPAEYFEQQKVDEEDKAFEVPSMTDDRKKRILYIACLLASQGPWFSYDADTRRFTVAPSYQKDSVSNIVARQDLDELPDAEPLEKSSLLDST